MKLLLAEDTSDLNRVVTAGLNHFGYEVDQAYDGEEALNYIYQNGYDTIILDIMMPKKNGLEVLREIRQANIITPVLMLTAKAEIDDRVEGLDSGADDYLTKPFVTGELLARIRAMTRRSNNNPDINPKYCDIILDIKKGELICGNNSVILGRKEFQMMELLISNAGQIITKEQFVKKIWGYDDDSEYNNVEVYISFLRKKLTMLHSCVQIKTRRGVGYCLDYGMKK